MSIDDFMADDFDSEDEVEDDDHDDDGSKTEKKKPKSGKDSKITGHKKSLEKLKTSDPEFFEFLQENEGGLLDFDESDDSEMESEEDEDGDGAADDVDSDDEFDDEEEEEEESGDDDDMETKKSNELDSDEEDFVDEEGDGSKRKKRGGIPVTLALVDKWRQQLENHSVKALREVMKAFRAAVQQSGSEEHVRTKYSVDGSASFNAVVSLCLKQVYPVLQHSLDLEDKAGKT
nr:nucleolar complex protein 2 homolog [Lytechinus pictus]